MRFFIESSYNIEDFLNLDLAIDFYSSSSLLTASLVK
jgi:hypothetical protein